MASINVRKETGKLYIDFRYRNIRCREQTELRDTPGNRKRLQTLVDKVEAEILLGQFDYAATFPNSNKLAKFQKLDAANNSVAVVPTFAEFAQLWFDELSVQWRESYKKTVELLLSSRLIPYFGELSLDEISKPQILQFRAELCKQQKPDGTCLSPSYINRYMKLLRAILNEGADRYEFQTPYKGIKPLKVKRTDINPFTPDEIVTLLETLREDFRDYYTVRFFTGMRTGEIDGLKWRYVDFEKRLIYIRETIVGGREEYTKNDFSQRDVQMSEPVYQALKSMQERTGQNTFVFVNQNGNPLDHNLVTKRVWYPLLRKLGFEKRNPYQTRHTAATLWLASGENPTWIAYQLGHANTEMLFRVYSRYVPNLTRQDGREADSLFLRILNKPNEK
ncbi:Arm DNA-binding domain-containing protein [Alteromonas sp. CYL-A6]|uniref:Arm DNA-binding domain-containing protein n=1 Tax=Alteromonas nitratireducens TaxID=3390813 RepID=UPI0034BED365